MNSSRYHRTFATIDLFLGGLNAGFFCISTSPLNGLVAAICLLFGTWHLINYRKDESKL